MPYSTKICLFVLCLRIIGGARVAMDTDFDNINEFVAKLEEVSGTFRDFVITTEAIFCPERFNCSLEGQVESKENILKRLPTDIFIRNESVKLENIKHLVGVRCLPCSCSETCYKIGNCCPVKLLNTNNIEVNNSIDQLSGIMQNTNDVLTECIASSVKSYQNKNIEGQYNNFYMITKCNSSYSNSTLDENCKNPSAYGLRDVGPVTSNKTGLTYWNSHCAECNNDEDTMPWKANVELDREIVYFANMSSFTFPTTIEDLYTKLAQSRLGDIKYIPPVPLDSQMCLRKCDEMRVNEKIQITRELNFLKEACKVFKNPVIVRGFRSRIYPYRNLFCFLSQEIRIQGENEMSNCRYEDLFKSAPPQITALLDYETSKTSTQLDIRKGLRKVAQEKCPCDKIFDTNMRVCRQLYCPAGEILIGCRCIQPLKQLSGIPVLLVLKATPKNGNISHMTRTKMSSYHEAVRKGVLGTTDHISSEICATYRGVSADTDYFLTLAIVHSNPGWDTKQVMKPFLKYLDSTPYLRMRNTGVTYDVALTSRVLVHYGYDENLQKKALKAVNVSDLEFKNHTLTLVYSNATAFDNLKRLVLQRMYQVLSPLLYCTQIEFAGSEFYLKDGNVIIRTSSHMISVPYYYMVKRNKVRICASSYTQKLANPGSKPGNAPFLVAFICFQFFMFAWAQP